MADNDTPQPLFGPPPTPGTDGYTGDSAVLLSRWLYDSMRSIESNYQWRHTPVALGHFMAGNLPDPVKFEHNMITYLPATGHAYPAYSDGTSWYSVTLGTTVT